MSDAQAQFKAPLFSSFYFCSLVTVLQRETDWSGVNNNKVEIDTDITFFLPFLYREAPHQ